MIATMLIGGLGNQMFQYAAGRALALRRGVGLILDLSSFAANAGVAVHRAYELDRLRISARPASGGEQARFLLARRSHAALRRLSGFVPLRDAGAAFDPAVTAAADRSYLIGYWQSWRYFADHAAAIAAEMRPAAPLSPRSLAALAAMRGEESVSLHVRRGDYLSAQHAVHGVIDRAWYVAALGRLRCEVAKPVIHVFSDDLDWCREAFSGLRLDLRFADWNRGDDSWQDLYLMAACRHAIVANSSFSWWGGWLGDQGAATGRQVIAPARWFAGKETPMADRCPPAWELL